MQREEEIPEPASKSCDPPTAEDLKQLRKIWPTYSDERFMESEQNLLAYLADLIPMYERICKDPVKYAQMKKELWTRKDARIQSKLRYNTRQQPHPTILLGGRRSRYYCDHMLEW